MKSGSGVFSATIDTNRLPEGPPKRLPTAFYSRLFVSPVTENFVEPDAWRPKTNDDCEFSGRIRSIITAFEWL